MSKDGLKGWQDAIDSMSITHSQGVANDLDAEIARSQQLVVNAAALPAFTAQARTPSAIVIGSNGRDHTVFIRPNGTVALGEGVNLDDASRMFWQVVEQMGIQRHADLHDKLLQAEVLLAEWRSLGRQIEDDHTITWELHNKIQKLIERST